MAAGLGSELFTLATSFDPYGAYRKGQMEPQKYDLQQAALDEQTQELNAERQQALKGAQTGQPLAQMTNQLIPGAKLASADGMPTTAGQMNSMLMNSMNLAKQGKQMMRMAATLDDPVQQAQVMSEGRRLVQNAQQDSVKAQELYRNTQNDAIYAAATAQSPQEWNNALKAYQDSGFPIPQGIPTEYSPENVKKIAALAPAALQSKINNDLFKRAQDKRAEDRAERVARSAIASERDGVFGKEYKDVKGQVRGLTQYLPMNVIKDISAKEVPVVASRLESSKLTGELADMVAGNPKSAGLAASLIKTFDKYLPERYDSNTEASDTISTKLNTAIDEWTPKGAKPDEIAEARSIAKKAVDVINARALAASGGSRMLVSELKLQKDVIGLENLSPKSAVKVYTDLAEADLKGLSKYGIARSEIKGFDRKPVEAPKEETKPTEDKPSIPKAPEGVPAGAQYSPSQKKWWWQENGQWKSK